MYVDIIACSLATTQTGPGIRNEEPLSRKSTCIIWMSIMMKRSAPGTCHGVFRAPPEGASGTSNEGLDALKCEQ